MDKHEKSPLEHWKEVKKILDTALITNEVEKAFYCLEEYLKTNHQDDDEKKDDLVIYRSQFEAINKKWSQTLITHEEHEITLNKIKQGLIQLHKSLINKIPDQIGAKNRGIEKIEDSENTKIGIANTTIDYDWNFEENLTLFFQFETTNDESVSIFSALIEDASWKQFIRRYWYLITDEEPLGVRIPETVEPDEDFFRDEKGFIKLEERLLLWLDAVRFEVKDDEKNVIAESIVIRKRAEGQVWIHAIGEAEAKSRFVSSLLRWFDEKLHGNLNYTVCLCVPKGRGGYIQPINKNDLEISIKQPFGIL